MNRLGWVVLFLILSLVALAGILHAAPAPSVGIIVVTHHSGDDMGEVARDAVSSADAALQKAGLQNSVSVLEYHFDKDAERRFCEQVLHVQADQLPMIGFAEMNGPSVQRVVELNHLAAASDAEGVVARAHNYLVRVSQPQAIATFTPHPAPSIVIPRTPDAIARGRYLGLHVCVCMDCHARRDWGSYTAPVLPDTLGVGGVLFDQQYGFAGKIWSANITPAGIGTWTDGEVLRAITEGVNKDDQLLYPIMRYPDYRFLAQSDAQALVAWLRTLEPHASQVPARQLDAGAQAILNAAPHAAAPIGVEPPPRTNPVAYGKYLVTIAGCANCHTPGYRFGKPEAGKAFAGGESFYLPGGRIVRPANLTPDPTGIGRWDADMFVGRFKTFETKARFEVTPDRPMTIMPWSSYAGMTESDLRAIYAYLRTLKPVSNQFDHFDWVKKP